MRIYEEFERFMRRKNIFTYGELRALRRWSQNPLKVFSIILEGRSSGEVFSSYKLLDRSPFNSVQFQERGLHIARIIYSSQLRFIKDDVLYNRFKNEGLIIVPDAVKLEDPIDSIVELMEEYPATSSKSFENIVTDKSPPPIRRVLDQLTVPKEQAFVQRVERDPAIDDEQEVPHSDTFFPALKWWWFPEDVEEGTFCYAKFSPVIKQELLDFYYRESIKIAEGNVEAWRGRGHAEGSFRFSDNELKALGVKYEPVTIKANTLVLANVFGVHGRGPVGRKCRRLALHGSLRPNRPFGFPAS